MASRYSATKESAAHAAKTMSQARRLMPQAGPSEVRAIAAGIKETRENPLTRPTMPERTVAWAKLARPSSERGSRRREMRPSMSVSFRGRAHAPHVRVIGELLGGAAGDEASPV